MHTLDIHHNNSRLSQRQNQYQQQPEDDQDQHDYQHYHHDENHYHKPHHNENQQQQQPMTNNNDQIAGDNSIKAIIASSLTALNPKNIDLNKKSSSISSSLPNKHNKHHHHKAKSSNIQASFTLFKVFFGVGILVLPSVFASVGLYIALIGIIIVGLLTYYCMRLILHVADHMDNDNIQLYDITKLILGDTGSYLTQACLMLLQVSICIGSLIFCHMLLKDIICTYQIANFCESSTFYIVFSLAIGLPLSLITNLHYFAIPSLFANIFIIIGLILLIHYDIKTLDTISTIELDKRLETFHLTNIPLFFGVAVFAYEGIGVMFNIRSSMKNPKHFVNILKIQFPILTILYLMIPTICYLAFGDATNGIVFLNLPQTNTLYVIMELLYIVGLLCGYPIQIYPLFNIIENSYLGKWLLYENCVGDTTSLVAQRRHLHHKYNESNDGQSHGGTHGSSHGDGGDMVNGNENKNGDAANANANGGYGEGFTGNEVAGNDAAKDKIEDNHNAGIGIPNSDNMDNNGSNIHRSDTDHNHLHIKNKENFAIKFKRILIRLTLISLMFLIAYTTKSFPLYINLVGSLIFVIISFVLPILVYNKYYEDKISIAKRIFNYIMLIFSVVLGSFGVIASIHNLYQFIVINLILSILLIIIYFFLNLSFHYSLNGQNSHNDQIFQILESGITVKGIQEQYQNVKRK